MHFYSSMSCDTILCVYGIELRAEEKIGKFGFTSLGIVEVMLSTAVDEGSVSIFTPIEKCSTFTRGRTKGKTAPNKHDCKSVC